MASSSAKESKKVAKVRKKLKKMIAEEKKQYTSEALQEMTKTIHKWITRHEPERISIKDKSFRLFNENERPAETKSKFVQELFSHLSQDFNKGEEPGLKGRISSDNP